MSARKDVLQIDEFKEYFYSYKSFSADDIELFYSSIQQNVHSATLKTRIHRLIKKGIIKRTRKNSYAMGSEKKLVPIFDNELKSLYKEIKSQFPLLKLCIWNTKIINHLMIHQPGVFYTIIEVESDKEQRLMHAHSVYNFLNEQHNNVFLDPKEEVFELYVSLARNAFIVIPLVSEAPLQNVENIATITIEKLLVDLYCEKVLFTAQQGAELATIFEEAFEKYTINQTKLFRYASRRSQKKGISNYLNELNLIDD